jgi:hypothetical protein
MSSTNWVTEHVGPGENASRETQQQEGLGEEGGYEETEACSSPSLEETEACSLPSLSLSYEETEACSLPSLSLSVTTIAAAGELGVDGGRIDVPLAPTGMKPSIYFTSKRTESIEAVERSFCLDAN